ncbi:hypothetical protein [Brucella pituitosa]|uniref:hypothetical protein n=1 Tax=Brucella pituitosa TaxID=571256 RepID=UPI003F4ACAAA
MFKKQNASLQLVSHQRNKKMGFQFVHIETYSRSGGRNDKLNVAEIISEARRSPEACQHVENPKNPILVYGCDFDALIFRHDIMIEQAQETLSNGKKRALRKDTSSLFTCIISHPATPEECRENPEIKADVEAWAKATVKWLRDDIEKRGGTLDAVIMHTDEAHVHLHAYGLHNSGHADNLHPGKIAKKAAAKAAVDNGMDKKAANTMGDKAYVEAMRQWQDSYSEKVGLPHGLTRLGPARRRLSRADWQREKAASNSVQQANKMAAHAISAAKMAIKVQEQQKAAAQHIIETAQEFATSTVEDARRDAASLVEDAQQKVGRIRSLGNWVRNLIDGLRVSKISAAIWDDVKLRFEHERKKSAELQRELKTEKLRGAALATKLNNSEHALHAALHERNKLRSERDKLQHATVDQNLPNMPKIR